MHSLGTLRKLNEEATTLRRPDEWFRVQGIGWKAICKSCGLCYDASSGAIVYQYPHCPYCYFNGHCGGIEIIGNETAFIDLCEEHASG